jgi:beta-1,4-mannosyltransferase
LPKLDNSVRSRIRALFFCFKLLLLRLFGIRVVWTVHNLKSHEGVAKDLELTLARGVVRASSWIVVHSPAAEQIVRKEFSMQHAKKIVCIPHGNYIGVYPNVVSNEEARYKIGISSEELVFLFLGLIRPYKGVNDLVDQFKRLEAPNVRLVIAGKPISSESVGELKERIGNDDRISLIPGYVQDTDLQFYFGSADVAVYPYKEVLTSGAIVLGMSFAKACVAPRIGCIPDYLDEHGAFLYSGGGGEALYLSLLSVLDKHERLKSMGEYNLMRAKSWDWSIISAQTSELYR